MLKKSHYIILVVVVLVVLVLLKLPGETMGKVKLAISGLFLPLFGLASSTHELIGEARNGLATKSELVRQIEQLRTENQQLKVQLDQDASLRSENARLRAATGWQAQTRWKVKPARVIARDPANWWRSLQLDLGARDGIRTNLPVLTPDGLVGRIQSVSDRRSQVILLGDPDLRVAAIVETSHETGIITAGSSLPQEQGMIDLDLLSGNNSGAPGANRLDVGRRRRVSRRHSDWKNCRYPPEGIRTFDGSARKTGSQPGRPGGSLGDGAMNWLHSILVLAAAFLAVFLEATIDLPRHLFGAQIDLLPALMVYTALTSGFATIALLAVCGGLWFDSLSLNPLGASVLPLLVIGAVIYRSRGLLLREHAFAQAVLGVSAAAFQPLGTLFILLNLAPRRCWVGFHSGNGWSWRWPAAS